MISFKMFAGTNIGLRDNNEDNFLVCPDLTLNEWIVPDNSQELPLGKNGCLMVVADGMGGQNAGEVASEIAIETVKEMFAPDNLPKDILVKPDSIKNYLKKVIFEADIRVKERGKKDKSAAGLGSTIVIVWLIGEKAYVAWLGDSRAYSYIKNKGIGRISKDHSYVQQLVDAGIISDEDAMTHPQSNIITRSLGDTTQKAKPDVMEYTVENDEIILICSDGLCGVCKDEFIGGILDEEFDNLQECKEKLTTAALAAGGSDNITIALLRIKNDNGGNKGEEHLRENMNKNNKRLLWLLLVPFLIIAIVCIMPFLNNCPDEIASQDNDTLKYSLRLDKEKLILKECNKVRFWIEPNGDNFIFDYSDSLFVIKDSCFVFNADKINKNLDYTIKGYKIVNQDTTKYISAILYIINETLSSPNKSSINEKEETEIINGDGDGKDNINVTSSNAGSGSVNKNPQSIP